MDPVLTGSISPIELLCFHKELQHERIKVGDVFLKLSGSFVLLYQIQLLYNAVSRHYIGYFLNAFYNDSVLIDVQNRDLKGYQHRWLHQIHR